MRARVLFAFLLTVPFVADAGSAPRGGDEPALLPAGLVESLRYHADPEIVLRVMARALDREPRRVAPAARWDTTAATASTRRARRAYRDVPISADPGLTEYRPAVAVNPGLPNVLVVAHVAASFSPVPETRCLVRQSQDQGATWSSYVFLPVLTATSVCDGPALAYSPDGRTLYAAYRDFKGGGQSLPAPPGTTRFRIFQQVDILLSRSRDDGRTWSDPVFAIEGDGWYFVRENGTTIVEEDPGETLERPTIATAPGSPDTGRVYVTANSLAVLQPEEAPPTSILFARSSDGGRNWGHREVLDEGVAGDPAVIVQGSRVAAGPKGEVLVAWYASGTDGPRKGTFEIRTRRSGNHGARWDDFVVAAVNEVELDLNLGPFPTQKTWWTAMFPDVAVDDRGRAHVAYTHDPEPGSATAEEGDIRWVSSRRAPFDAWSSPVTLNDDGPGRAQGFPSLAARGPFVEAVWEDSRLAAVDNYGYDVYHSRLEPGRFRGWSANRRVSDVTSTQDAVSNGERTGLAAHPAGLVFAVWTDRRDKATTGDGEDDVYGSRVSTR